MPVTAPPPSELADTLLARLPAVYGAAADAGRAAQMRAYMKDVAPFLGLTSPVRRELSRTVLDGTPRPDETDLTAVALRCWALPEREYAYFAPSTTCAATCGACRPASCPSPAGS